MILSRRRLIRRRSLRLIRRRVRDLPSGRDLSPRRRRDRGGADRVARQSGGALLLVSVCRRVCFRNARFRRRAQPLLRVLRIFQRLPRGGFLFLLGCSFFFVTLGTGTRLRAQRFLRVGRRSAFLTLGGGLRLVRLLRRRPFRGVVLLGFGGNNRSRRRRRPSRGSGLFHRIRAGPLLLATRLLLRTRTSGEVGTLCRNCSTRSSNIRFGFRDAHASPAFARGGAVHTLFLRRVAQFRDDYVASGVVW